MGSMYKYGRTRAARAAMALGLVALIGQSTSAVAAEWDFGGSVELNTHIRNSERNRYPTMFPTGSALETVDQGANIEVSRLTLNLLATDHELMTLRGKIDAIDLHDRNSTSDDKNIDVDNLWFRYGRETSPGVAAPDELTGYVKVGKFPKFERQNDRHLESYGLVSTAFNRFEDHGLELGAGTKNFYARASATAGNPVFLRDPNALAGDNGTSRRFPPRLDSELESGVVVLYDAEVEDLEWSNDYAELGLGLGWRHSGDDFDVNILAFAYDRKLKREADLFGTLYGGDLDILSADKFVVNGLKNDDKREYGINLWLYYMDFTVFAQLVAQDIGGLGRVGAEVELAYRWQTPWDLSYGERSFLTQITPAVRYSRLDADFGGPGNYPAPSIWWDWEKYDMGVTFEVMKNVELVTEYAMNRFERAGVSEYNNEFLATLRWQINF